MVNQVKKMLATLLILTVTTDVGMVENNMYRYDHTEEVLNNPMMGFSPDADDKEAVGENTLVYLDVTFRELEPQEGVYDFDTIIQDNNLAEWKEKGKKVVFRFLCDDPGDEEHMDIPDWLYEKTKDGTFYDMDYGKGYSPDYENKTFIKEHEKAIRALGDKFGQDNFFCYIEMGSLGHWGEWHVKYDEGIERFPSEKVALLYIKPYIDAFPNAKLLMRRPFKAVTTYKMGVYNDMTGALEDTNEWITWIKKGGKYTDPKKPYILKAYPDIWNDSPVGGEFTSSISMKNMLTTNLDRTLRLIRKSHMTFIGPKCLESDKEAIQYPQAYNDIMKSIGYRYAVSNCTTKYNKMDGTLSLTMTFENTGVAPMYFPWKAFAYLYSEDGTIIKKQALNIDLTKITQNKTQTVATKFEDTALMETQLTVGVGIENPDTNTAEVYLNMDAERDGCIYKLY